VTKNGAAAVHDRIASAWKGAGINVETHFLWRKTRGACCDQTPARPDSSSLSDYASSTAVPAAWAKNRGAVVKYDPIFSSIAAIFYLTPPKPRDELHSLTGC